MALCARTNDNGLLQKKVRIKKNLPATNVVFWKHRTTSRFHNYEHSYFLKTSSRYLFENRNRLSGG